MPDSALLKECPRPVDLGDKPLTQRVLEHLWVTDRASLLDCYRRHLALRNFVLDRDAGLRGEK